MARSKVASNDAALRGRLLRTFTRAKINISVVGRTDPWLQAVIHSPLMATALQKEFTPSGVNKWALKFAYQLLQRYMCGRLVLHEEDSRGWRYDVYARVRLDTTFLAPLSCSLLDSIRDETSAAAFVPEGEDYGGLSDRLLLGRRAAFLADSTEYTAFVDGGARVAPNWAMEDVHAAHLHSQSMRVKRFPLAYCLAGRGRSCKYLNELNRSATILPSLRLARPKVCDDPRLTPGKPVGLGCCRPSGAPRADAVVPWSSPPTATSIAALFRGVITRAACARECAAHAHCTHYEYSLNALGVEVEGHIAGDVGHCWIFASGGHAVGGACDNHSGRVLCFEAARRTPAAPEWQQLARRPEDRLDVAGESRRCGAAADAIRCVTEGRVLVTEIWPCDEREHDWSVMLGSANDK